MAKIKTSELQGAALDYAVAKCERDLLPSGGAMTQTWPNYSTDWSQGGPIIEREGITLQKSRTSWKAELEREDSAYRYGFGRGPSQLIAAMRCYVASKLGDQVEIPDALM